MDADLGPSGVSTVCENAGVSGDDVVVRSGEIFVYVDTTAFHGAPLLDAGGWPELLDRSRRREVQLFLSEVVLRESDRRVRDRLGTAVEKVRSARKELVSCGADNLDADRVLRGAESAAEAYLPTVRQTLNAAGATELAVPIVSVEELLSRDLARRRPFDEKGKGFRDTLIWTSIIQHLRASEAEPSKVILVTKNSKDFLDDGQLHGDLLSDVRNVVETRFEVFDTVSILVRDLNGLFAERDSQRQERDRRAAREATLASVRQEVTTAVRDRAIGLIGTPVADRWNPEDHLTLGADFGEFVPREFVDVVAKAVYPDDEVDTLEMVRPEEGGESYSLRVSIGAEVTIEGIVAKKDYPLMEDDEGVSWPRFGVDQYVVVVEKTGRCQLHFNVLMIEGEPSEVVFDYAVRPTDAL